MENMIMIGRELTVNEYGIVLIVLFSIFSGLCFYASKKWKTGEL